MAKVKIPRNTKLKLLNLHEGVRDKLAASIADSSYCIDSVLDDLDNQELALLAAKVNNKLNRRLNSEFDV